MAASNWKIYGPAALAMAKGDFDLDLPIRMVLVTSVYVPDQALHDTWADISANEVAAGGGYATHGAALTTKTVTQTGLVVEGDSDDVSWPASTITAKFAVLVQDADSNGILAATDKVLAYSDLNDGGGSLSSVNGTLTVAMHATNGFLQMTAS